MTYSAQFAGNATADCMAGITLDQAQTALANWLAADAAVSKNQSYSLGGRTLSRADAREIRENISYWNRVVMRLSRGSGARIRYGVHE